MVVLTRLPYAVQAAALAIVTMAAVSCDEQGAVPAPEPGVTGDVASRDLARGESPAPGRGVGNEESLESKSARYLTLKRDYGQRSTPENQRDPEILGLQRRLGELAAEIARDHLPPGTPREEVIRILGVPDDHIHESRYLYVGRPGGWVWSFGFDEGGRIAASGEVGISF